MSRNKILKYIRIGVYIVFIISIILLKYTNIFNNGRCYINENLGILCPTCGITRATQAIINLDISVAVGYNAYYVFVLLPIFLILLVDDVICMIINKKSFVEIILGE